MRTLVLLIAGYLIGSIPFAVLAGRASGGFDTLSQGTRNPGATNIFKNVGRAAGALVGLLDYFKALVPPLVAERFLGASLEEAIGVGIAVVLGHDFSIFLGLRGGKGGASTLGVFTYIDFPALIITGIAWGLSLPMLGGRRFVAGPLALTLFPILSALGAYPPVSWLLPGWRRPTGLVPLLGAAVLLGLLWLRIAPGLRRRAPERKT